MKILRGELSCSLVTQILGWRRISGAQPVRMSPLTEGCEGRALLVLPSCSCCDHLSPSHLDTQGWADSPGSLCVSGTEFHHVAWSFSTTSQIPVTFETAWEWERGTSSSSALRTGHVWTNIISHHYRDNCLMPMMGVPCVSQSYCLCLSEQQCFFS